MKLSILVATLHTRFHTYYPRVMSQLYEQWYQLEDHLRSQVEIITLSDTKVMTVGEKRNRLVDMASGDYVAFVDDDDWVQPDYLKSLVLATFSDMDVITFKVAVSINDGQPKLCVYSKSFKKDHNTTVEYRRLPNHLMATRRDLVTQVKFKEANFGEDSDYATRLKPLLKTEFAIPKVLYHYDYNDETTETRDGQRRPGNFV